jgi:hypothetical protein
VPPGGVDAARSEAIHQHYIGVGLEALKKALHPLPGRKILYAGHRPGCTDLVVVHRQQKFLMQFRGSFAGF